MKILVTGAAGFIGSHLTERLLNQGHQVIALDDLSTGRVNYLKDVAAHPHLTFVKGSVLDQALLGKVLDGCEAVFHLAAVLGVKNTVDNPLKVIEGNIDSTRNVLELAYQKKIKVIFASTSEVYGKNTELPFQEHESNRVLGSTKTHRWCYATAKALDEHLCFAYEKMGLPITVIRYFNAYGPRQNGTQYGQVVPKFIEAALKGEPIPVYGTGDQARCFTHVNDIVDGTISCLDSKANGEIINLGKDEVTTINELATMIKRISNSTSLITHISYEEAYGKGFEDMEKRIPDITRAKELLNYSPSLNLETGLKQTIDWYRNNISEKNERP
ncbi:NAD-dependent epimerase/dehydratase family protein [Halobacillus litoralis]|uniref:NAD-dependent epimerase/dehydratase family protein n=1 Tax=Halobacillus litoralis TaxID=45668 RepID=UPI001CD20DC8|nr:NAD-dependent epimerase/dehydratase family protein [Halobacillus litoralis]MCA0970448.1 NAD-dependent epimerase/dehydratase family protein [Halobacillus litoralis]